jgi:FkbM family methyltransferase
MLSKISFKESMKSASRFDEKFIWTDPNWELFQKLYEKNYINAIKQEVLLIPKIIHQIWLGSEFPEKYRTFQQSWLKNHKEWEYILWTDKNINKLKLINKIAFNKTENLGAKSDILRYEILYQFGGLYIDTDFECIKPFDELHFLNDFYTGIHDYKDSTIPNGLIACSPRHRIIWHCISQLKNVFSNEDSNKIMEQTGPYFFTKQIVPFLNEESAKIVVLPSSYFYPFPNTLRNLALKDRTPYIKAESFAIHHWEVSWLNEPIINRRRSISFIMLGKSKGKSFLRIIKRIIFLILRKLASLLSKGANLIENKEKQNTFNTVQIDQNTPINRWFNDKGDKTHRLNYELNENSLVLDLGGYEGQWASDIFGKYLCNIYVFEPYQEYFNNLKKRFEQNSKIKLFNFGLASKESQVTLNISADSSSIFKTGSNTAQVLLQSASDFFIQHKISKIDLIKINIEGGEYDLLDHLIESKYISKINNIQVQFHDFFPNAKERMEKIQIELSKTHKRTYYFEFVWENWELK